MEPLILASGSPRRKDLMELLPWPFEIKVAEVEEKVEHHLSLLQNVQQLALKKAKAVAIHNPDRIVIGADTMVGTDEKLLGKPSNKEEAFKMLEGLSGQWHRVITGVAIVHLEKNLQYTFYEETKVKMSHLTASEIKAYIETGEPLDKAGSYAIQGIGARYIEGIEGDYFNVVGLPVHRLYQELIYRTQ